MSDPVAEDEIAEHVLDGGMEIIILCRYGDRQLPVSAHLMQCNHAGVRGDVASVPIPAFVRQDVNFPVTYPFFEWFGIHQ